MQTDSKQALPQLSFCGAAGTVTGSKHLIDWDGRRVLLDCGMFQGLKDLRLRNWGEPPFQPRSIDAIVLSHAHIDHSGYLPLLVKRGYRGPIYCTPATAALLRILLTDAARLMEEEADFANRHAYSKHSPALPLYSSEDVEGVFPLLQTRGYAQPFEVLAGLQVTLRRTGHILGAASVDLLWEGLGKRLVFSGDLGRWGRPILRDPEPVPHADVLMIESTYGDREHRRDAPAQLARVLRETAQRGGAVLIPAFAVGRVQELLWTLRQLEDRGEVPQLPVFVDSPMAIDVTELSVRFPEEHDEAMQAALRSGNCPLSSHEYHPTRTVEQSKALNTRKGPMVIIAGNGMMTGGRILHHLRQHLDNPRSSIVLVGYQAAGTRGRALLDGATGLRMHGQTVPVRAQVEVIDGLSAHADRGELLRWLRSFDAPPQKTYLVHGEPGPAQSLAKTLHDQLGWDVAVAEDGQTVPLFEEHAV